MPKLYLVRRNLETFLGPMTVEQLKKSYQKMEFGLQDEVASSYGRWVTFDDLDRINKLYPELTPVVRETMLDGWGFSQNSATRIIEKGTAKREIGDRGPKGVSFGLTLVLVLIVVGFSAYYIAKHTQAGHRFFNISNSDPAAKFNKLLRSGEKSSFLNLFKGNKTAILKNAKKSNENLKKWLPSFRAYAFLGGGSLDGISPRLIKGPLEAKSPALCTYDYWKKQWKMALEDLDTMSLSYPKSQTLSDWQKILIWDPYWIARRSDENLWIYPQNYYHGCLIMAHRAFKDLKRYYEENDPRKVACLMVEGRLNQMIGIIEHRKITSPKISNDGKEIDNQEVASLLSTLGCLDSIDSVASAEECRAVNAVPSTWKKYIKYRTNISMLRVQLDLISRSATKSDLDIVSRYAGSVSRSDLITGFQYQAETRYVRNLLRNDGDVAKSINELKYQHQNVNFLIGH